jgi:Carbonic anhydrases/acetyltransferases, isoleucine patch superfamily
MMIFEYMGSVPQIGEDVFIAEGAKVIGNVTVGSKSSIWFNTILRGDVHYIRIGERTNIQDNSVIHVTNGKFPVNIGCGVTIGHGAIIHGCEIKDYCLIGMGAIILDGSSIGDHSLVAAGSVVREGLEVPPRSLVAGVPGKIMRELTDDELVKLEESAARYVRYAADYLFQTKG